MVTRRSYANDPVMNLHQAEQDFSIFGKKEEIYKLYPKEKPEHIDTALEEFLTVGQDDEDDFDSSWDRFTKILASIIVEDMIANLGG